MSFSLDALNTIRANASTDYQERIPQATRDNLQSIGQAFAVYTPLYNEFCSALLNRIGLTLFEQATFSNKLKSFKLGQITSQQDVQEIFTSMAKAEGAYDKTGANPLGRRDPADVAVVYHRQNRQDKYVMSIGDIDFRRNFTSPAALDTFLSAQLNSIYMADEYDEWVLFKHLLATYSFTPKGSGTAKSYFDYEVPAMTADNQSSAMKTFVKTLKKAVQDMSFMSNQFNAAGVMRRTSPDNYALLVNKDILPEISIEVLMSAFNMEQADIKPPIITMDDFDEMTKVDERKVYGLLIEKDFCRIWDTLVHSEQIRNPDGLFTNTFYHHHQILSLSPFKNAVRLIEAPSLS